MTEENLLATLIFPDWPAPDRVRAVSTTRLGGVSLPPYDSLNLGYRAGDEPDHVAINRRRLRQALNLPEAPRWLRQMHGSRAIETERIGVETEADAAWTREPGQVCVVLTADCLPVLFCDWTGSRVAIAHAGWRGLAKGVLAVTLGRMNCVPAEVLVWLGPAIGSQVFEVGEEVRDIFIGLDSDAANCFTPSPTGRWLGDIYALARQQLRILGIREIYGGGWCTYSEPERFFSYRRDGQRSGRMASLIWLEE